MQAQSPGRTRQQRKDSKFRVKGSSKWTLGAAASAGGGPGGGAGAGASGGAGAGATLLASITVAVIYWIRWRTESDVNWYGKWIFKFNSKEREDWARILHLRWRKSEKWNIFLSMVLISYNSLLKTKTLSHCLIPTNISSIKHLLEMPLPAWIITWGTPAMSRREVVTRIVFSHFVNQSLLRVTLFS